MASYDLRRILSDWPYEPGQITVRKIAGEDGRVKIQMRLDLGLLQMEAVGRPDGQRPNNFESLLDFHRHALNEHTRRNGTNLGFQLTPDECFALREEAMMYYHRYLSLFVLEEFDGVERDTARNIDVLDLCNKYAAEEEDRNSLEPYRCYLIMMNTRAKAHQALRKKSYKTALAFVNAGLQAINDHLASINAEEAFDDASEVEILQSLRAEIVERVPVDPAANLQKQIQSAITEERYEEAAKLRDRLQKLRSRRAARRSKKSGGDAA